MSGGISHIKAVLFDLDGTLVDTEALSDKAILYALKSVLPQKIYAELERDGFLLPWELKRLLLGLRGSEWGPIVISYAISKWGVEESAAPTVQQLWAAWEDNLNTMCAQVQPCPGAPQLVARLSQLGIPMAIATSSRREAVQKKGKNHQDMFSKMQAIVAGDDQGVTHGKPAPDIYLEAARRLNVHPKDCLVFEDALSGAKAGKAARCSVVFVPDHRFTAADKKAFQNVADVVLDDLWQFDGTPFGIPVNMTAERSADGLFEQ